MILDPLRSSYLAPIWYLFLIRDSINQERRMEKIPANLLGVCEPLQDQTLESKLARKLLDGPVR